MFRNKDAYKKYWLQKYIIQKSFKITRIFTPIINISNFQNYSKYNLQKKLTKNFDKLIKNARSSTKPGSHLSARPLAHADLELIVGQSVTGGPVDRRHYEGVTDGMALLLQLVRKRDDLHVLELQAALEEGHLVAEGLDHVGLDAQLLHRLGVGLAQLVFGVLAQLFGFFCEKMIIYRERKLLFILAGSGGGA